MKVPAHHEDDSLLSPPGVVFQESRANSVMSLIDDPGKSPFILFEFILIITSRANLVIKTAIRWRVLLTLQRHISNYFTLYRSDIAACRFPANNDNIILVEVFARLS